MNIIEQMMGRKKQENTTRVISAQRLDVFPELYAKAALILPMVIVVRPGHAGRSSS